MIWRISISAYYFRTQAMKSGFQTRIGPSEFDTCCCCCSCIRGSYIYHVKREWRKRRGREGRDFWMKSEGGGGRCSPRTWVFLDLSHASHKFEGRIRPRPHRGRRNRRRSHFSASDISDSTELRAVWLELFEFTVRILDATCNSNPRDNLETRDTLV